MLDFPSFLRPHLFLTALPLALAATTFIWWYGFKLRLAAFAQYGSEELLVRFMTMPRWSRQIPVLIVLNLAVLLMVTAAAGPYYPLAPLQVPARSMRLVVVHDGSPSFGAEDYRPYGPLYGLPDCSQTTGPCGSRLDLARQMLLDIMPRVEGNQFALVSFVGTSAVLSHLTYDQGALYELINEWKWMRLGNAKGLGSDITEGLVAARQLLEKAGKKDGIQDVVLLFSDGGFTGDDDELFAAADALKQAGIKLIVVGLGGQAATSIPIYEGGEPAGFWKTKRGDVALTARDDKTLLTLATRAGSNVLTVDPGEKLNLNWPTTLAGKRLDMGRQDLYQYPLALAMALVAMLWLRGWVASLSRTAWRSKQIIRARA